MKMLINKSINNVINALQTVSDKHAPVKKTIEEKNKAVNETLDIRLGNSCLRLIFLVKILLKSNFIKHITIN